ncbi:hypothetical protein [Streptomyces canus]|uniref:hypothetical protein n=1 Tax=Streptomyces canus TaxID=58343 RepID=UPI0027D8BEC8|nr:hypothetical protein [Streptomyces canus]
MTVPHRLRPAHVLCFLSRTAGAAGLCCGSVAWARGLPSLAGPHRLGVDARSVLLQLELLVRGAVFMCGSVVWA